MAPWVRAAEASAADGPAGPAPARRPRNQGVRPLSGDDEFPVPSAVGVIDRFAPFLAGAAAAADVLDAVARVAVEAVDGADTAVISVVRDNAPATFAGSHRLVTVLDAVQFATGEGPSFRALCDRRTVRVDDVSRWDGGDTWREMATGAGMAGVLALPVGGDAAATLSLYRRSKGGWSAGDVQDARGFAVRLRDLIVVTFGRPGDRPGGGAHGRRGYRLRGRPGDPRTGA